MYGHVWWHDGQLSDGHLSDNVSQGGSLTRVLQEFCFEARSVNKSFINIEKNAQKTEDVEKISFETMVIKSQTRTPKTKTKQKRII